MKILHISYSDLDGGAARAALRLHQAQRRHGLDSHMLVVHRLSDDPFVHSMGKVKAARTKIANAVATRFLQLQKTQNSVLHSLNIFPSGILQHIDNLNPDIVNLHWLGGEMMSISEIAKIRQAVVWTLHDMWPFSGAEHYGHPEIAERYKYHYRWSNRPATDSGWDLNRWIFHRKRKAWATARFSVVTPSAWLGGCARASVLFGDKNVTVIPNCIDHTVYRPHSKESCRDLLSLPQDKMLLLFGAMSSTCDPRKGYVYLKKALELLCERHLSSKMELVVFGASRGQTEEDIGVRTHYLGRIHDDITLVALYNAVDMFVAPSLQDNLPNTVVESLACGTPCVAFNIGGMPELITSDSEGRLASKVSAEGLAEAIESLLDQGKGPNAAANSQSKRGENVVAQAYKAVYQRTLSRYAH